MMTLAQLRQAVKRGRRMVSDVRYSSSFTGESCVAFSIPVIAVDLRGKAVRLESKENPEKEHWVPLTLGLLERLRFDENGPPCQEVRQFVPRRTLWSNP
jgi:hypothetical protein